MTADLTYASYAAVLAAMVALQVTRARRGRLTLGRLVRRLSVNRMATAAVFLGWAWLGWHLFVRGSVTFLH